jgi:hypothetical protein
MRMIVIILLTSCSTTYSQKQLWKEQDTYKEACNNWYQEIGYKMTERMPGEESYPVQMIINLRCNENPDICLPPRKHQELKTIEYYWNTEVTPEYCSSTKGFFNA